MKKVLTLDFGGSALKYALIDENRILSECGSVLPPRECEEQFLDTICGLVDKFDSHIQGIAISSPGQINTETGAYRYVGQYPFLNERCIYDVLASHLSLPVSIENDANCAIYAEQQFGSLRGEKNAVMLVLGTGIGGGIIINNEIFHGNHFTSGEFSLMRVDGNDSSLKNSWFYQGGILGLTGMAKQALKTNEELNGRTIFELIQKGNTVLTDVLEEYARKLAIQIYNVQAAFDVDKIAIGGGISVQKILIEKIDEKLQEIYNNEAPRKLPPVKPQIVQSAFGNDANLIGAYCFYRKKYGR